MLEEALAVVNGFPAISYDWHYGGHYEHLKYVKATGADGTNWRYPVILDKANFGYPSLKIVSGCPAISYRRKFDKLTFAIYYLRVSYYQVDAAGAGLSRCSRRFRASLPQSAFATFIMP